MQMYTVPEVARLLKVKKGYIYELIYQGKLRAIRLSERRIRIPQEALHEFIEKENGRAVQN
ncbi:MAG: helix-turn-helix domain-containing protein [Peptococcaceae bacterium]|nr:helix-turn-helix domain-containing protein [Peptococcaceae bacterium]